MTNSNTPTDPDLGAPNPDFGAPDENQKPVGGGEESTPEPEMLGLGLDGDAIGEGGGIAL